MGSSLSANGGEVFRWTEAGGMVSLGASAVSWGDVSADGSVVVGGTLSANGHEAFRWIEAEGMVGLGDLPGGGFYSYATEVSADGSEIGRAHV